MDLRKEKDKPRKLKVKSVTKLKKELDALVSKYVRISAADQDGIVKCYTCDWSGHWKKIQNGHLVSRYYLATRYDLNNCRPQCYTCNMFRNGMIPHYAERLEEELGKGIVAEMYSKARELTKDYPYQKWIDYYKPLVKELEG